MRILLITDRIPGTDTGYGLRITNVVNGLIAAASLDVCLIDSSSGGVSLPTADGYAATTLRAHEHRRWQKAAEAALGIPRLTYGNQSRLRAEVSASIGQRSWDLVWCSRVRTHALTSGIVRGPRIVDFDDLNDRLESTKRRDRRERHGLLSTAPRNVAGLLATLRWQRVQQRIAVDVDYVAVCSEVDRRHLDVPNAVVVPNGYPDPCVSGSVRPRLPDLRPVLLFVGPLTYEPNRLAVDWMVRDVMPLVRQLAPDVTLEVVGEYRGVEARLPRGPGVVFHGRVPDVTSYYERSAVAVTPLQSGGGTRIKVIEALARGVPLVSTSFACEGLPLAAGRDVLVADDAVGFSQACLAVLDDPALGARLAAAGRTRFLDGLTAADSSAAVEALARRAVAEHEPASRADGDAP